MAPSRKTQHDLIVRTKLNRPPPPPDLVQRERLVELLQTNPDRSLTLVSAPAGYGKSTLVSRWLDVIDVPAVYLSLDAEDNELWAFLRYFIEAVRMHSPKACRRTHEFLGAAELPPPTVLGDYLVNDLQAIKRPFILVVDDYHRIHEQAVHDMLSQVLRHPCRSFHLVLVTRHDPPLALAALRARGRTREIRESDLRFTRAESREAILKMGGLSIGDETLAHLDAGLEGWIAGLRLVCLTLRNQSDPEGFLATLDGSMPDVREYLLEEVLKQLPPDFKECLLKTSILNRFCAPLCEAICRKDGCALTGERFIQELEQANLFTVPLDDRGTWVRYHHLFQHLLRHLLDQRLAPDEIRSLHEKASRWFASNELIDEALDHALAADERDLAAEIVEAHRVEILNADKWPVLAGWLARLPEDVVWRRPELLLGEAWLAYYRFRIPALARIVERLDVQLGAGDSRPEWVGELSMFKSFLLYWQGQTRDMLAQVGKAQDLLPETHDLMRADSEIYFGLAHHLAGEKEYAIDALTRRIREQPEQKGLMLTRRVITLAFIRMLAGDLREGIVYSRQLGELARTSSPVYITSWSTYLLGCCHFQSGHWEEAEKCFRWMVDNRYVSHTGAVMSSLVGLGLTLCFLGRAEESPAMGQLLQDYAGETKDPANLVLAAAGRARIELLRGDGEGAGPAHEDTDLATAFVFLEVPQVTWCRQLVVRGSEDHLKRALEMIHRLQQAAESIHNTFHLIDLVTLKAVAFHKLEQFDEANGALKYALDLAAPGRWVRPFVEAGPLMVGLLRECRVAQANRILSAFPQTPPAKPPTADIALVESLTNRERDVLECLAERLYDKEIVDRLSVSLSTVKTHLRNIYSKLAVANRRQAVIKAEALGLLKK